jgi:hypothetical protein
MEQDQAPHSADQQDEKQEKPHQKILKSKAFIPSVVVIGLILMVLLSSRLTGRPPQIDSITPKTGKPGDVMIITGRYFGQERGGDVEISGISPTSGEYVEWTDSSISVVIPDEAGSGLVYVSTKNGRSRGILFINSDQIPVLAAGPSKPGAPYIDLIQPMAAHIGETITIKGKNFGLEKGSSEVYFTWAGGAKPDVGSVFDTENLVPAREYDFDFMSWSDIEIVLRVPDGAASGNLMVASDKGKSNSQYFEVLGGAGMKYFPDSRKYSIRYGISVKDVAVSGDNCLYLWMPHMMTTAEQRRVQLVSEEPAPMLGNHNGAALFALTDMQKGTLYTITLSYTFDRYTVETQVTPSKVPAAYDTSSELYKHFTSPDIDVPSSNPEIVKSLPAILQGEKNPYLKARRIYDFILSQLTYSTSAKGTDPAATMKAKRGDDFAYAALACTLLRAAGVPSRIVAGYLIREGDLPPSRHFWDELYVDTLGWIPIDPLLGDEKTLSFPPAGSGADPTNFFFGNLDNRHVTLTKGLEVVSQMSPEGKVQRKPEMPFLLSHTEESTGGITDYRTVFEDLVEVPGSY